MKNVDPAAARIAEGLVVDMAKADKNIIVVAADQTHDAIPDLGVPGEADTREG